MKPLLTFFLQFFLLAKGICQNEKIGTMVDPAWKSRIEEVGDAWKGSGYIIKGTIYFHDDMHKGYITLQNGKSAKDVLIRYNVYTHEISYIEDKIEMILDAVAPVREFGYDYTINDEPRNVIFRSGYPAIGKNTAKSFYQVVVDRDIALLKYTSKKILEERTELGALQKVIIDTDTWFIYNAADNNFAEIKKNKNSLMEALPQYASRIKSIIDAKNLRLKSDADWYILLSELTAK
jgi:hypothetical protein